MALAAHATQPEALLSWEQSGTIYAQRYALLTADFAASPLSGAAPLTVTFTNHSTPTTAIEGSLWDFGDGYTDTVSQPVHSYDQAGIYTVSLTVTGPGGSDTLTRTNYITVSGGSTYSTTTTVITYILRQTQDRPTIP